MALLNHNKRRNCGLIYEFLAREIADAAVKDDPRRAERALRVVDRHFGPDKFLHEELMVHRNVVESRGCSERLARTIIDQVKSASIRLAAQENRRQRAKTAMIHELNRTFGQEIFDRRVPDYQMHASIGIMLARGLGQISEGVDIARVEEALVSFLTTSPDVAAAADGANAYAYETAVRLYQEEYGRELSGPQSELLREYVRVTLGGRPEPFERLFGRQRDSLAESLGRARSDEAFRSDADMARRLDEGLDALVRLRPDDRDSGVEALMGYWGLLGEINR